VGEREGKQIIPADYFGEMVKTHTSFNANLGYGYQNWWTIPLDGYYYAPGIGGQRIYVMEKQDLVIVTTADLPEDARQKAKCAR
jgi:CubicO group peptidase (beta-lactamase class C family)